MPHVCLVYMSPNNDSIIRDWKTFSKAAQWQVETRCLANNYLPGVSRPINANSVVKETCIRSMNSKGCKLFTMTRSMPNLDVLSMSNSYKPFSKKNKNKKYNNHSHCLLIHYCQALNIIVGVSPQILILMLL